MEGSISTKEQLDLKDALRYLKIMLHCIKKSTPLFFDVEMRLFREQFGKKSLTFREFWIFEKYAFLTVLEFHPISHRVKFYTWHKNGNGCQSLSFGAIFVVLSRTFMFFQVALARTSRITPSKKFKKTGMGGSRYFALTTLRKTHENIISAMGSMAGGGTHVQNMTVLGRMVAVMQHVKVLMTPSRKTGPAEPGVHVDAQNQRVRQSLYGRMSDSKGNPMSLFVFSWHPFEHGIT